MAHIDDGNDVPAFYTAAVATTCVFPASYIFWCNKLLQFLLYCGSSVMVSRLTICECRSCMQSTTFCMRPVVVSLPVVMSVVLIPCRNVKALRKLSMSWLPLLCSTFIAAPTEQRGPLGDAIAAYACISSPDVVSGFFTTAMQKFIQVLIAVLPRALSLFDTYSYSGMQQFPDSIYLEPCCLSPWVHDAF